MSAGVTAAAGIGAAVGWWRPGVIAADMASMAAAVYDLGRPLVAIHSSGRLALGTGGRLAYGDLDAPPGTLPLLGFAPPCRPGALGDPGFLAAHGLRYAYVTGAMANGIGSEAIVEAMANAGMLGFFGAGGLPLPRVEAALDRLVALGDRPWGMNLLHAPNEPEHEAATVALYLARGVRLVEAAAYLDLTLPLVRFRTAGIYQRPDGTICAPHRVMAKVSRIEVASKFFAPPPPAMLAALVEEGHLTPQQAEWAARIAVAEDLTAEADSGGHTDNRPAVTLLPTMLALRDRQQALFGPDVRLRVGAAGGMATPASLAAAYAMGAAYVVTGSINQACVESGASDPVRTMLAAAQQADVAMCPAGDMFEMGVKVQVLKRGTMFPMRASKLYEFYRAHAGLAELPPAQVAMLEKDLFRAPLAAIWDETRTYFLARDPGQVHRAEQDPKHQMALVFRWYLGHASRWANAGVPDRKMDYQVWCGPAMGAFNEWTRDTWLADAAAREVVPVARNLMAGACALARVQALRLGGVALPPATSTAPVMARNVVDAQFLEG